MVFDVLKTVTTQEVTQDGKRAGLYTHGFVMSIDSYKHSMDFTSEVNV